MIIHADMDAFYASVEIRENPQLAHRPVVVAGSAQQRGVVCAANYISRQFGIHSAMPTRIAQQRCSELVILPVRIALYAQVSRQIHTIFNRYTPLIEPLSLDEAFLDVTRSNKLFGSAEQIGRRIKRDVADELKLVISVGVAVNKFIAKIASDINKPDGFVCVPQGNEQAFLDPLPVTRIWGIGKQTNQKLAKFGIRTIRQLRELPNLFLQQQFGKQGQHIWQLANGVDHRQVITEHEAKSISHERTFASDMRDREALLHQLSDLTEQVAWRLRNKQIQTSTVQLKIRLADFSLITRAHSLPTSTNQTSDLWPAVKALFLKESPKLKQAIRLIGMGATNLNKPGETGFEQTDLFGTSKSRLTELDKLSDQINQRFGRYTASRGSSLKKH